jgi:hypothetical protein
VVIFTSEAFVVGSPSRAGLLDLKNLICWAPAKLRLQFKAYAGLSWSQGGPSKAPVPFSVPEGCTGSSVETIGGVASRQLCL